jgi:hypothetical protein
MLVVLVCGDDKYQENCEKTLSLREWANALADRLRALFAQL